eukprot:6394130-Amphidinium_carterae.1
MQSLQQSCHNCAWMHGADFQDTNGATDTCGTDCRPISSYHWLGPPCGLAGWTFCIAECVVTLLWGGVARSLRMSSLDHSTRCTALCCSSSGLTELQQHGSNTRRSSTPGRHSPVSAFAAACDLGALAVNLGAGRDC